MAKQIDFPDKEILSKQDYIKLTNHLRNSVIWYATNFSLNTGQIREKLRKKGLPEGTFKVDIDGTIESHDFYKEAIRFLESALLVDDRGYAERLIEREFARGKSLPQVKATLWQKKVSSELAEELLEEYLDSDQAKEDAREALEKIYQRTLKSYKYQKALRENKPPFELKRIVIQAMMSKGFDWSSVESFIAEETSLDE